MAFPAIYYSDPVHAAMSKERSRVGCYVCANRERKKTGRGFRCAAGSSDWPDGVKGLCKWWARRKNK